MLIKIKKVLPALLLAIAFVAVWQARADAPEFTYVPPQQVIYWTPPAEFGEAATEWAPPEGFEKTAQPWAPPKGWETPPESWAPPKTFGKPQEWAPPSEFE